MTQLDDNDLVARLQALADGVPLPPNAPDDDVLRGRVRLRRIRIASACAVAAAVALVIGASFVYAGGNRADRPIPPVQTPTSTPSSDRVAHGPTTQPPYNLGYLFDGGDGIFLVQHGLVIWYGDGDGWERRSEVASSGLSFSPNGQEGYVDDGSVGNGFGGLVTHDGARTWHPLQVPDAHCPENDPVLLATGMYLPAGSCHPDTGYWLPAGSDTLERRPAAPVAGQAWFHSFGHVMVAVVGSPHEDGGLTVSRTLVSADTGWTWQEIVAPCPGSQAEVDADPDHTELLAMCGRGADRAVWRLRDVAGWEQLTDSSPPGLPVSPDTWLAHLDSGWELVRPEGSAPVAGLPADVVLWGGPATAGGDTYLLLGTAAQGDIAQLYVSRDGGLTWQKDGEPCGPSPQQWPCSSN